MSDSENPFVLLARITVKEGMVDAYLKIAEGCDRPCSFCAIPLMRGKHKSKSIENLVKEAKGVAANGVKELILIAQDLTYYGLDLYNERKLAALLTSLSKVEGIDWIRLHYAFHVTFKASCVIKFVVIADTSFLLIVIQLRFPWSPQE